MKVLLLAFSIFLVSCAHSSKSISSSGSERKWSKAECKQMREELISMTQTYVKTAPCRKDTDCQMITTPIVQVCGGKNFAYAGKHTSKARLDVIDSIKELIYENCQPRPENSKCKADTLYVPVCQDKVCGLKEIANED